jgi:hypothetical protein
MNVRSLLGEDPSVVEGQDRVTTGLCIAAAALILLTPAFINGYPLIHGDSGTYLRSAVELRPVDDRPIFYSIVLRLLHWRLSPWPIVIAQSATVAFIIHLVAKTVFCIKQPWVTVAVSAILSAASSLPWFVGQITPDVFAAVLMLVILLLAMGWKRMTKPERGFVLVVFAACISFHYANLMIALMAVPALALMFLLGWSPGPFAFGRFALVAGAISLALAALISVNVAMRGRYVISAASSTFMMAKLLEDGPALSILQEECPGKYALCSQLANLEAYKAAGVGPSLADYFLWYGPVRELGSFKAVEAEAADVVRKALRRYWSQQIFTAISNGARQLVHFEIGDELDRSPEASSPNPAAQILGSYPIESIRYVFGNSSVDALNRSLQGQGELYFGVINKICLAVIVLSIGVMAWTSVYSWRFDRFPLQVAVFTLIMVCGHAWLIGALTPLHDRYQSRVIWLLPLVATLIVIREVTAIRKRPSGLISTGL